MERITIFDTTLRDGEQAPGASMTLQDKVEIARRLALLGVDVIEAGFPVSSPQQSAAVRQVIQEVSGPTICGLARATEEDILAAGRALQGGGSTRIHTFIATSDIHLRSKFGSDRYGRSMPEKRHTVMGMAVDAIRYARTFTEDVEFSAEDAGRTEVAYLIEMIQAAIEAGATTINLPDTTGYCIPAEYAAIFETVRERCSLPDNVVLSAHCHDDLGFAVANSLAAAVAGARQIECTINGIGERAGNAALEEIAMAIQVRGDFFGFGTGIESRLLTPASRLVAECTGFAVPECKAIVGGNAFSHEAGIHQDGVLKDRATYEIMSAADVGQESESIRLGRHSGRRGLFQRFERLGIPVPEEQRQELYERFLEVADQKKEVHDSDLFFLLNKTTRTQMKTAFYRLDTMDVRVGTAVEPTATISVLHTADGDLVTRTATGDGPVDALYRAIDQAVGETHDLITYSIRSTSEGADAVGEVSVLIGYGGACFAGTARSTDVLRASVEAYLEALNHLAAYRVDRESVQFVGESIMQAFQGGSA
ncbi:MAG: 2-isopropylmalate synthase [Bacteroidetes bacterium]|nr:2-isopropylmalate synthase [Bacteroidota bacterium]